MLVAVVEHVQRTGVLIPPVKGNSHRDNVLGFLEVVRDAAALIVIRAVEDIPSARPARVRQEIAIPGVGWHAAIRAAAIAGRPRVVPSGVHVDQGPVTRVDEGWDGGGVRRIAW